MIFTSRSYADQRVSVIIPSHNRRHTLAAAVDSVLAQTLAVHELIVVDDGSDDGSSDWLREHYPDVLTLQQPNRGVSAARNTGIARSTGSWLAFLDSDDRWFPQKLACQFAELARYPKQRVCHTDEIWIRNGTRVNPKHKHRKYGGDIFTHCLPLCAMSPSSVMLHRSVIDDYGNFDESLPACEDYDLWLRITVNEPVAFVDELLLEKTGGHADQLSQRHSAMDRFRLYALAKLLRSGVANADQQLAALDIFHQRFEIYTNGARKRGLHQRIAEAQRNYEDLLG